MKDKSPPEAGFLSRALSALTSSRRYSKALFGDVLVQKKVISREQLQKAIEKQKSESQRLGKPVSLGQIIVDQGFAQEKDIIEAVNRAYGISAKSLADDIGKLRSEQELSGAGKFLRMRVPIRVKLSLALTFFLVIFTLVLGYFMLDRQTEHLYEESVKTGKVSLHYFSTNAKIPLLNDDALSLNSLIKDATAVEGLVYATIVDRNQIVKAHSDISLVDKVFRPAGQAEDFSEEGDVTYFTRKLETGEKILNLSKPITFQGKVLGAVHVGISLDFIQEKISGEKRAVYILGILSFLAGIVVTTILGVNFSRPISKLVLATKEISGGNFHHKVKLPRKDEFGDLADSFNFMSHELWLKSIMRESFGRYVSTKIRDLILADPENVWLKGVRNEATILFADVRGFTKYSETHEPEVIVEQLNEFFDVAAKHIEKYGGYIDKFIGDEILAVFGGLPDSTGDHAKQAVLAAYTMQQVLCSQKGTENPLLSRIGVSLNTGPVVSGNIGSEVRMEYTIIGDTVNVASRLNGIAKPGKIILSQSTYERVRNGVEATPLPPQKVKGKTEELQPYEIVSLKMRQESSGGTA